MAGVGAATIKGGVAACCDALEVDAASVVYGGAAVGDRVDPVGIGHGCGGLEAERGSGICAFHLALTRNSVWVHARRLWVEAASRLRIPLYTSGGRIGISDTAEAAHGFVVELLRGSRENPAENGAKQDANHHGSLHTQEDQEAHDAKESDSDPGARKVLACEGHKVHKHCWVVPDDVNAIASLQSNVGQEQADPRHGGLHHPCGEDLEDIAAEVEGGHDDEDHTLHGHSHHNLLYGVLCALETYYGVGEVSIHAHAWPQAKRQVRPKRHDQRSYAARHRCREHQAIEIETRGADDVRVDGHDVGRREEGCDSGADLRREVGAPLRHLEEIVHLRASELLVQHVVHHLLLALRSHLELRLDLRHGGFWQPAPAATPEKG